MIRHNLIINNGAGVFFDSLHKVIFEENTVTQNSYGFHVICYSNQSVLTNNNIYGNTNTISINAVMSWPTDMKVPNNWWGTTDSAAINQSVIYSSTVYTQPGTVDFAPILQAENPDAPKP